MLTLCVVVLEPVVYIALKLLDVCVKSFSKRNTVKLIEDGFMKPLTDTIGLRMLDFGLGIELLSSVM